MWYYMLDQQRIGPVDPEEVENLIAKKRITQQTLLWREGMADWLPASQTEFATVVKQYHPLPPAAGSQPTFPPAPSSSQASRDAQNLDLWFMIFWICLAVGIPTSIIFIGVAGLIAAVVFSCLILYKLWSLIPPQEAKTTPGVAVGFLFIPFFYFYWNFVAIHGLAQAMNNEMRRRNISGQFVNEQLTLAYCVVSCVGALGILVEVLPSLLFVVGFAFIAQIALLIVVLMQMKEAGKRLLLS